MANAKERDKVTARVVSLDGSIPPPPQTKAFLGRIASVRTVLRPIALLVGVLAFPILGILKLFKLDAEVYDWIENVMKFITILFGG